MSTIAYLSPVLLVMQPACVVGVPSEDAGEDSSSAVDDADDAGSLL